MTPTVIVCAGPVRSGSTWQYNAVRLLAQAARGQSYGALVTDYDPARPEPVHVVKVHDPAQATGLKGDAIVTCYRDLRDVLASARRMAWHNYNRPWRVVLFLDMYITHLAIWETQAVHVMRYEDMLADPLAQIGRLAASLDFVLTAAQLAQVCERVMALEPVLSTPTGVLGDYDRETLLHPGHILRQPTVLDGKSRLLVDDLYGGWLRRRGYAVEVRPARFLLRWHRSAALRRILTRWIRLHTLRRIYWRLRRLA